jgi:hypothetical protein
MPNENKVVLTTSIVVDIGAKETGGSRRLESIADRFQQAVSNAFKRSRIVEPTGGVRYDWLNDPNTNFGRCASCNRLVTDWQKPNMIRGMIEGRVVNGALLCDQCADFR